MNSERRLHRFYQTDLILLATLGTQVVETLRIGVGELLVVWGFLAGLSLAVATVARFVLRDVDDLALPIQPRGKIVVDYSSTVTVPTISDAACGTQT